MLTNQGWMGISVRSLCLVLMLGVCGAVDRYTISSGEFQSYSKLGAEIEPSAVEFIYSGHSRSQETAIL